MSFEYKNELKELNKRQQEIILSCELLYTKFCFDEITLTKISENTSLSRTAIYNYYNTKEEVFLDLLKAQHLKWCSDLKLLYTDMDNLSNEKLAKKLTETISHKTTLLKLLSLNLTYIENKCDMKKLIEFKKVYMEIFNVLELIIKKQYPRISEEKMKLATSNFFTMLLGIYRFTNLSKKQTEACKLANINIAPPNMYNLCEQNILMILNSI